jgi:hypothetical protein
MMRLADTTLTIGGWTLGHFQMMFLSSIVLRWFALVLIRSVRETNSQATMTLIVEVMESISWRVLFVTESSLPAEPTSVQEASAREAVVESRSPVAIPAMSSQAIPTPKHLRSGRLRPTAAERQ